METIKIQINHKEPLTVKKLATILYDEIGEEYDLVLEDIEEYFTFLSCTLLLNETFISVIEFTLPELVTRETTIKGIIFSFLNSLENISGVVSITKMNDSILQEMALEYYKQIIELEMDMRNVLTYIITYSTKTINEDFFKTFGINKSEKLDARNIKDNYENGLFYIYFNHYASFTQPQKVKAEKIAELLQEPNISSFEQLKTKLQDRGLKEDRHIDFIASIKEKLNPIEKMRNAIMHIRNISDKAIQDFTMATEDNGVNKGIRTIITDFWEQEKVILEKSTFIRLAKIEIQKILDTILISVDDNSFRVDYEEDNDYLDYDYEDIESLQRDIISYIEDEINILNYSITSDEYQELNTMIEEFLGETN